MTAGEMRQRDSAARQAHSGGMRGTEQRAPGKGTRDWLSALLSPSGKGEALSPEIRLEQMRMFAESQKLPLPYAFPLLMVPYAACFAGSIDWYWLHICIGR